MVRGTPSHPIPVLQSQYSCQSRGLTQCQSGSLIAKVIGENGVLDMRYQHVNVGGELVTGRCRSTPERLGDGRLRMHEVWQWTCGDMRIGRGVVEEVLGDGGV